MEKIQNNPVQRTQQLDSTEGTNVKSPPPFQLKTSGGKKGGGGTSTTTGITVKRNHIHLNGEDKYGHWWTELGPNESYGWWPKNPVGLVDTLGGTEGELNGQTSFGGTPTKDPHHGDAGEEVLNVVIDDPSKDENTVKQEMRDFANGYSGEWRWTFGGGQNCHTFQKAMLNNSGVKAE